MSKRAAPLYVLVICVCALLSSCKTDDPLIDSAGSGYPADIGKIMLTTCAVSGCHNTQSKNAAAGLDLSTWSKMFEGDRSGNNPTIPFSHGFSTTFLFSNTFADLGINTIRPTMPINANALSRDNMLKLRNWIDAGAPDRLGFVKFSDNAQRKKYYVVNQGCDVVTVFDEASLLPMRYIPVGTSSPHDSPHMIRVSPDGQYWYVSFLAYPYLQRYRTSDDSYAGQVFIGYDSYNTFTISSDSKTAYAVGYGAGNIATANLTTLTADTLRVGISSLHGSRLSPGDAALYVTATYGNYIVKFQDPTNLYSDTLITLDGSNHVNATKNMNPHDLVFAPDGKTYFVTCQGSDQVAMMDARTDKFIRLIQVGNKPQELSISASRNVLFVSCMEDSTASFSNAYTRGSVYAIDLTTYATTAINVGFQPHGLAVDDANGLVYVANRNVSLSGLAPHHTTSCGGRNGFLTYIDMNTMQILPGRKTELASDPYSVAIRP
jgi:DNA-binding beta-propeller fold protein YncE